MLLAGLAGCGASYQRVYEGDVRFEHCYRLDADPHVAQAVRQQCWADWAGSNTDGQTRDRVEYAASRQRALSTGDMRPAGPEVLLALPSPDRKGPRTLSNLNTIGRQSASLVARPSTPPAPSAPAPAGSAPEMSSSQTCRQDCGKTFTSCIVGCERTSCSQRCGDMVRACVDDCL
jgi:hypothetical protein